MSEVMLQFFRCFDDRGTTINDLNRYIKSRSKSQLANLLYPQDKKARDNFDYIGFFGEFKKLREEYPGGEVVSDILTKC